MAIDKEKNTQVLVTFPNEMLKDIEVYWHANSLKNRNEAIRKLVELGLSKEKETK
ncbi:ribbon-helix-helix domain-containing protein [Cytobacillus kochii]|uniref:ribbon-helix-helix domain-containing protein n=1 Tax=Cytobacillus kochii TaxID=859143 RepID=UPI003F800B9C